MEELADIPMPEVLDPARPLRPHGTEVLQDRRPESEVLGEALDRSCAYGRQLWAELDRVRAYLLDLLPPIPDDRAGTSAHQVENPQDDARWQAWVDMFAAVTSVLCGPAGDGGFGRERALREMRSRRGR
jgi:hypothetical protein